MQGARRSRARDASSSGLFRFLVIRVLAAELAKLLHAHAIGMRAFVLGQGIVPALTGAAGERDDIAHGLALDLRDDARPHRPSPLPNRKPQLLLHRYRRDQLD